MGTQQIGPLLKKYRKQNQLTVQDVVLELSNKYNMKVAEKTLYGWESSQARPSSDTFLALCDIYRISNISEAFLDNSENKGFLITPEERTLVEHFRQNPDLQKAVRKLLSM
jgi:transcriptional regulator with XRE-family HTH domain